jgi:hypothetical protein
MGQTESWRYDAGPTWVKDGSRACLTITGTNPKVVVRCFANGLTELHWGSRGKPIIPSDWA